MTCNKKIISAHNVVECKFVSFLFLENLQNNEGQLKNAITAEGNLENQ